MADRFHVLGTDRLQVPGFEPKGALDSVETIPVSFWLAASGKNVQQDALEMMATPIRKRNYLTAAQLQQNYGSDPDSVQAVKNFAVKHELGPVEAANNARLLTMQVRSDQVVTLFGVELQTYRSLDGRQYRGRTGKISLSADDFPLEKDRNNILGVFGLDNRRQARQASPYGAPGRLSGSDQLFAADLEAELFAEMKDSVGDGESVASIGPDPYPPAFYGFPAPDAAGEWPAGLLQLTGKGQTVGILGFGGAITVPELVGLAGSAPTAAQISVQSFRDPANQKIDPRFTPETKMDVAIAFTCAPQMNAIVFVLDETDQGWAAGLQKILELDPIPSVLSVSWGWLEAGGDSQVLWTEAAINGIEDLLAALVLRGVTTLVASGDDGRLIWYPGSSAFVLSCGGSINPGPDEGVWSSGTSSSGGGISGIVKMPGWQSNAKIECKGTQVELDPKGNRCLPDVAAVSFGPGSSASLDLAGTSAAAPLWAGLVALANQYFQMQSSEPQQTAKTVGNFNAQLYDEASGLRHTCNDIVNGNNSIDSRMPPYYSAAGGWDACTGWGSPNAMKFIQTLVTGRPSPES